MGKLPKGINGPLVGKAGKVHGSSRNGVEYVKGPHKKRTKKVTKKESNNRDRFGVSQFWLKPILAFVKVGFNGYSRTCYGFAAAKSDLMMHAMEGFKPFVTVNPALAKVSFGNLPLSPNAAVALISPKVLKFSWDKSYVKGTDARDQVMMLAYDVEKKLVMSQVTGKFREDGEDLLTVSKRKGAVYQVYIAFIAADRSRQSDSLYLGTIAV